MSHQLSNLKETLVADLATLRAAGAQAIVVGPAALTLSQGVPLPPEMRPVVVVDRAITPTIADGLRSLVDLRVADDLRSDAETIAKQWPIGPWRLMVDAQRCTEAAEGAIEDVHKGQLRLVKDPRKWLRGNVSRILDVAVWAAQTGLQPTREVVRAAKRDAGHVLTLDRAIWRDRFNTLLVSWRASVGLQFLFDCGALPLMLHEVCAMHSFHESCPVHHKDIWDHTLQVVDKCPPTLSVRWTALMHDTGKVWTRTVNAKGKVHFFRHEELGASLMKGVAARFELDGDLADRVCYVIANHARANVYSTEWTDSAVRRLIRDMGSHLDDVIAFSRSDYTTKRAWRIKEVRELGVELIRRIDEVRAIDSRVAPLPKGLGNAFMAATERGPGRWLGDIQRWLESEVEAGRLEGGLSAPEYVAYVQRHNSALIESN